MMVLRVVLPALLTGCLAAIGVAGACSGGTRERSVGTSSAGGAVPDAAAVDQRFGFDSDAPGHPPANFHFALTGEGAPGRWIVKPASDAPSGGQVLEQADADPAEMRFPIAIADAPVLADLRLSVRGKALSGDVDQAFGLVFRYRDQDNYYLVRANALEGNVRLYHVRDGRRTQLRSWSGEVTAGAWHTLDVRAIDNELRVAFDGQPLIEAHDATFPEPGRVGVWTKADAVSQFDDLLVEPVEP